MPVTAEQHYSRDHMLEDILASLKQSGFDKNKIERKDLPGFDEFHIRGTEVTRELAAKAGLEKDMKLLDVGCGIGGPCRLLADEYGCITTGIDITREYIRIATALSELTRLNNRTNFIHGSALQLPFEDNSFDRVWTQHVQMNIAEKKQFYSEISRVLKPGGRFIYYDIFSVQHQPIRFPLPWADSIELSHLVTTIELRKLLQDSGLELAEAADQTIPGLRAMNVLIEKMIQQQIPPLSLRLLLGESMPEKFQNLRQNMVEKKLQLESGICYKK